tara:strand:- start:1906 stop:2400 length:495 start_codon:yes stop_codon:yes gene_type:complete
MSLIMIAAVSENNVIGNKGKIPWHLPEDLKRFRDLTLNKPIIMGRRTYDSILERNGKPLDKRVNIVLTSSEVEERRVITANSLGEAIRTARKIDDDIYVIGGERVYRDSIITAKQMELTKVHRKFEGDAFFPKINPNKWKLYSEENGMSEEGKVYYSFLTYERK